MAMASSGGGAGASASSSSRTNSKKAATSELDSAHSISGLSTYRRPPRATCAADIKDPDDERFGSMLFQTTHIES